MAIKKVNKAVKSLKFLLFRLNLPSPEIILCAPCHHFATYRRKGKTFPDLSLNVFIFYQHFVMIVETYQQGL